MFVLTDDRAEETETEDRAIGTPPTHEHEPPAACLNPCSTGQVSYSCLLQPFRVRVYERVRVKTSQTHHHHNLLCTPKISDPVGHQRSIKDFRPLFTSICVPNVSAC